MKKILPLLLGLCFTTLGSLPAFAQSTENPQRHIVAAAPASAPKLTKFDLDFPGGTPEQLVNAIQRAMDRPLNAIIPVDYATWKLPPLKMNGVDVQQLFRALSFASSHTAIVEFGNSFNQVQQEVGFRTNNNNNFNGPPETDDSIWYFYVFGASTAPKTSRFYLLKPYLDSGLTVDDITTAIQTGWKMRGDSEPPALSFHKETKLLIAFGDNSGLNVIDQVLKALEPVKAKPAPDKSEKPAEAPKTKP